MKIETMQEWLEALEAQHSPVYGTSQTARAIASLRQAIEDEKNRERNFCERCGKRLGKNDWDVHTCTPPASEKQESDDLTIAYMSGVYDGKKQAIAEAEKQEPFGWYSAQEDEFMTHKIRKEHERLNSYTHKVGKFDLALYTSPPYVPSERQRPVATPHKPLTDEQIAKCMISVDDPIRWGKLGAGCEPMVKQFARAIEAAHGIKGEA